MKVMKAEFLLKKALEIKDRYKEHGNVLILFRDGDFYNTVGDDAVKATSVLGVVCSTDNGIAVAGFPYYNLDEYLTPLVRAGHRVAIVEKLNQETA